MQRIFIEIKDVAKMILFFVFRFFILCSLKKWQSSQLLYLDMACPGNHFHAYATTTPLYSYQRLVSGPCPPRAIYLDCFTHSHWYIPPTPETTYIDYALGPVDLYNLTLPTLEPYLHTDMQITLSCRDLLLTICLEDIYDLSLIHI